MHAVLRDDETIWSKAFGCKKIVFNLHADIVSAVDRDGPGVDHANIVADIYLRATRLAATHILFLYTRQ